MTTVALLALLVSVSGAAADVQPIFDRIFGDFARIDPARAAEVTKGKPGQRHYFDTDGDGKPDEVWFIDTAPRHPEEMRPILVRVIDEDGDLEEGDEPDLDSDLYIADWKADGSIDVFCDYTDNDGDNDVDEMAFYFRSPMKSDRPEVMVWWGRDVGDDNLLWYDVGYTYRQNDCQYRTHFGGDEVFSAFALGVDDAVWIPAWENPFAFYDHDHDGVTEEVIRIEGRMEAIHNLRYSFDADDDATPDNPRDFDVSITAHAAPNLAVDPAHSMNRTLRGIKTGPFIAYHAVPDFSLAQTWADMLLTWDENDLNIDGDDFREGKFMDTQERWEGIIAKGCDGFKQVGGPSCGLYNNRYELRTSPGPVRVYYSPADFRIHLYGADKSRLIVDYDYDQKPDARYAFEDTNFDGYIDSWSFDADGDGNIDDRWSSESVAKDIPYTWPEVNATHAAALADIPPRLLHLCLRLLNAAEKSGAAPDPIWAAINQGYVFPNLDPAVSARLASSVETLRYYLELVRDRAIVQLKKRHDMPRFWAAFDAARGSGDIDGMRAAIEQEFELAGPLPALEEFRAGIQAGSAQPRVAWMQDWVPPNIGWESDLAAYRAYWGQFDFFGKTRPGLILPDIAQAGNYHQQQDWGMDALHVGQTCGLGGLTLYINGKSCPAYSPGGAGPIKWSKRLIEQTPNRITVEMKGENIGPEANPCTVTFTCSASAGERASVIDAVIQGGNPNDTIEAAIGLTRLKQEQLLIDTQTGVLASRGTQEPETGAIGLGIVFPRGKFLRYEQTPAEHHVVLSVHRDEPFRYLIQGDWLNGRRFPRCPSLNDWAKELRSLAGKGWMAADSGPPAT